MYGYGDKKNPLPESMALLEGMTVDYLQQVLNRAAEAAQHRQTREKHAEDVAVKVRERDLLFVLRKDQRRLLRVKELLEVWEEQKDARQGKAPESYAQDDDEG